MWPLETYSITSHSIIKHGLLIFIPHSQLILLVTNQLGSMQMAIKWLYHHHKNMPAAKCSDDDHMTVELCSSHKYEDWSQSFFCLFFLHHNNFEQSLNKKVCEDYLYLQISSFIHFFINTLNKWTFAVCLQAVRSHIQNENF